MRHKWADLIIQWAEGAQIEYLHENEWWTTDRPQWHDDIEYRVKPDSEVQDPKSVGIRVYSYEAFGEHRCHQNDKPNATLILDEQTKETDA
jgi:hypothetical protein